MSTCFDNPVTSTPNAAEPVTATPNVAEPVTATPNRRNRRRKKKGSGLAALGPIPENNCVDDNFTATTPASYVQESVSPGKQMTLWALNACREFLGAENRRGPFTSIWPNGTYQENFDHILHLAVLNDDHETVKSRIRQHNADPNQVSSYLEATELVWAAIYGSAKAANELLLWGAEVERPTAWHGTALQLAVMYGKADCVRVLAAWGAKVNRIAYIPPWLQFFGFRILGCTPIVVASGVLEHAETVKTLLDSKANPWIKNHAGQTAFDVTSSTPTGREISGILNQWLWLEFQKFKANNSEPVE